MTAALDPRAIRADFPLLAHHGDSPLVYLDSAATSQKPSVVIDALRDYYEHTNANVARGVYALAEASTNAMENARRRVARFIGAPSADEIVFTKNATEALNLVAWSWGRANLAEGDAVVLSQMEHHANIVPWQILAAERGIELRWISVAPDGTITPMRQMADAAHAAGALVCVDACQYVPHLPTSVTELDADFLAFSGHKMCGPTGVGVLWGRRELLDAMPPFLGGGGMIEQVTQDGFTTAAVPHKFEAGTPPIAEIVGLGAAVDYLSSIGMERIREHEVALTAYALRTLHERFGDRLTVHGPSEPAMRGGVFSLALAEVHPHDICVRAGHHCAKPLMKVLGVGATARASVYLYNDEADIDALADALAEAESFFAL